MAELIPRRVRVDLREWLVVHSVLREIYDLFEAEGFSQRDPAVEVDGQRRELVERYYASADWSDERWRSRFLRVCEAVLAMPHAVDDPATVRLRGALEREGYSIDEVGRIRHAHLSRLDVDALPDESAIRLHLARIDEAVDDRPEETIGAAKDLIEATAKHVLHELGEDVPQRATVGELVRLAQRKLALHPEVVSPTKEGSETIKRIVGALGSIATGIAELRNLYGTGHGQLRRPTGLHPRHARLAAQVTQAYVTFLLETLNDPRAPWRRQQRESA